MIEMAWEADVLPSRVRDLIIQHQSAKEHLKRASASKSPAWYGLNEEMGEVRMGFFVGVGRLPIPESPLLQVVSRFKDLDYSAMFACCATDPIVSNRLDQTFFVWPEQAPVPLREIVRPDQFTRLLVYAFVNATAKLCARHIRRGSVRVIENLQGRIKGRVLVSQQLHQNLSRFRPDRSVCSFARFDLDTLENRILYAALEAGAAFLSRWHAEADILVHPQIAASRAALSGVKLVRIHACDHLLAKSTGAMACYRTPLRLARAVLAHIGLDPGNLDDPHRLRDVPPFALATSELFERYCEVLLRRQYPNMEAPVERENLGIGLRVRPDYMVSQGGKGWIVDAKFKEDWHWSRPRHRGDVYQVVSYSRHKAVLDRLRNLGMTSDIPRVAILYPDLDDGWRGSGPLDNVEVRHDSLADFEVPLRRIPVFCPRRTKGPE